MWADMHAKTPCNHPEQSILHQHFESRQPQKASATFFLLGGTNYLQPTTMTKNRRRQKLITTSKKAPVPRRQESEKQGNREAAAHLEKFTRTSTKESPPTQWILKEPKTKDGDPQQDAGSTNVNETLEHPWCTDLSNEPGTHPHPHPDRA